MSLGFWGKRWEEKRNERDRVPFVFCSFDSAVCCYFVILCEFEIERICLDWFIASNKYSVKIISYKQIFYLQILSQLCDYYYCLITEKKKSINNISLFLIYLWWVEHHNFIFSSSQHFDHLEFCTWIKK
jgi:hypothetical protein